MQSNKKIRSAVQKHGSSVKKHDSEVFPTRNPSPERIQGDAHANKQH